MTLLPIDEIDWRIMKRAREKPSFYCEKLLGITPYYYQINALDDAYKFKILLMARQLGKTQTLAFLASWKINMFPNSTVGIIAQNEKRAKEIYNAVRELQGINPMFRDLIETDLQSEMKLINGSRVLFYASGTEGKSIRGATLDLLLMDEGDFVPDAVYSAAFPTVSATDGNIVLSSTPNKPYSMFYEIFMDAWEANRKYNGVDERSEHDLENDIIYDTPIGKKYKYVSYHYDYTAGLNVINPRTGKPQTNITLVNTFKNKNYYEYEREYLAWWSEESGSFLTPQTLAQSIVKNNYFLKGEKFYAMGLDLGRVNDFTAITILEVNDARDMAIVVDTFTIRKNSWENIVVEILKYARKWKILFLYLDANNVGDMMSNWLASLSKQGALFQVIPIKMSLQSKTLMYNNLKMAINTGRIKIQYHHQKLLEELAHMQAIETDNGMMKIHSPPGKHDDLADSLALVAKVLMLPTDIADYSPVDVIAQNTLEKYENYGKDDEYTADFYFETPAINDESFSPDFDF